MRCHICDVVLSEKEVKINSEHKDFEPCTTCLDVINDVFEPLDEEEISRLLEEEWPEVYEPQEPSTENSP
jgi:hypothetical protein